LFLIIKFFIKEIPEEKQFQNDKNNEKLYQYYDPHALTPPRHASEPVIVKSEHSLYQRR
jgi:hypothetical protein